MYMSKNDLASGTIEQELKKLGCLKSDKIGDGLSQYNSGKTLDDQERKTTADRKRRDLSTDGNIIGHNNIINLIKDVSMSPNPITPSERIKTVNSMTNMGNYNSGASTTNPQTYKYSSSTQIKKELIPDAKISPNRNPKYEKGPKSSFRGSPGEFYDIELGSDTISGNHDKAPNQQLKENLSKEFCLKQILKTKEKYLKHNLNSDPNAQYDQTSGSDVYRTRTGGVTGSDVYNKRENISNSN